MVATIKSTALRNVSNSKSPVAELMNIKEVLNTSKIIEKTSEGFNFTVSLLSCVAYYAVNVPFSVLGVGAMGQ